MKFCDNDNPVNEEVNKQNRRNPSMTEFSTRFRGETTYLSVSRSYSVLESTRSTMTRSIQLSGKRSHACQSIK